MSRRNRQTRWGLTSVRPERSGAESKGWGWVGAVLRLCFGSTGRPFDAAQDRGAGPFGLAYDLPSTSLHSAVLRSASLRTNGGRCFAQALRRGSGCSGGGASLFVSPVKTWRGLTSVRPERSRRVGVGLSRYFDFAQGHRGGERRPFDAAQDRGAGPFGLAYDLPSTSLHSALLRSASLRTNGGRRFAQALRLGSGCSVWGPLRMRGGGCAEFVSFFLKNFVGPHIRSP